MKRKVLFLCVIMAMMVLCACQKKELATKSNLTVKVEPAVIKLDEEGLKRIYYNYSVDNNSGETYKDTEITFKLDSKMLNYLQTGVCNYDYDFIMTMVPKEQEVDKDNNEVAKGISSNYSLLLATEKQLEESDIEMKETDLLKAAGNVKIHITWDGGEETRSFQIDVTDETE